MQSGTAEAKSNAAAGRGEVRPGGHWYYGGQAPEERETQIARILGEFDFSRVHRAMLALNWEWATTRGVPSVAAMMETAAYLMRLVQAGNHTATGGFCVDCDADGALTLSFQLESATGDEWIPC